MKPYTKKQIVYICENIKIKVNSQNPILAAVLLAQKSTSHMQPQPPEAFSLKLFTIKRYQDSFEGI